MCADGRTVMWRITWNENRVGSRHMSSGSVCYKIIVFRFFPTHFQICLVFFALHNLPPVFGTLMTTKPVCPACRCLFKVHMSILCTLLYRHSWKSALLCFMCHVIRHWRYGISQWNVYFTMHIVVFPCRVPYTTSSNATDPVWYISQSDSTRLTMTI